jgi:TonB family protein
MNAQRIGIVTSLAIHAGLLAVLLSIPVANAVPYMKTMYIRFAQQEERSSTNKKEEKAFARRQTGKIEQFSQPVTVTAVNTGRDESIFTDIPAKPAIQKSEARTVEKTEIAALGKAQRQTVTDTVFGNTGAPSFIHQETPAYPLLARRLGKEGKVVLKLHIDRNGLLKNIEIIEPSQFGFTEAALEAMKKSTFIPAQRNGEKIASRAVLSIRFHLK